MVKPCYKPCYNLVTEFYTKIDGQVRISNSMVKLLYQFSNNLA